MDFKDKRIFHKLNKDLDFIKTRYSEENIFGIYTYDNCQRVVCIVIPTFEEVCLDKNLIFEQFAMDNHLLFIIDIRYTYHATRDGYPQIIEGVYTDYYIINPRYEMIYQKLFREHRDKFKAGIKNNTPPEELKIAIMKIMRTVFNDNSAVVRFIKQLTDTEKTAIEQIIAAVGDEGIFSQAKVATAAGISRAAMTNLVMKMQLSGVAEIKYMGKKGTYFKIIDYTLMRIRG